MFSIHLIYHGYENQVNPFQHAIVFLAYIDTREEFSDVCRCRRGANIVESEQYLIDLGLKNITSS